MENQIFEPIDVIAFFHNLKVEIVKFKWKNDVYNVSRVNSTWKVPTGEAFEYHFSVICEKQKVVCELAYNLNDFKWQLIQYECYN
ncbi:MAG TPA: hypothetical protein VN514_02425 [Ignavibacteria bacterium]|nr:hypothetical protein [Ignavibacteria bacterium]